MEDIDMGKEQAKDKQLVHVIQCLKRSDTNSDYGNYGLDGSVLYRKPDETFEFSRPVIPRHLRSKILTWHHNCLLAAHIGRDRTFECIAKRYFWSGMYVDTQRWVAACEKCINHKRLKPKQHGLLVPIQSTYPFEIVSIDIIGPFKETSNGYKHILVMVDMFTSWVEAAPLRTLEAQETAQVIFKEIITRHGCPTQILTDRGTQFSANLFDAFCTKLRIKHPKISALHPQCNGKCERFNRFIKEALATIINERQTDWDTLIDCCLFAYRTSINTKVQETPFYLLYGRDVVLPSDLLFNIRKNDALDTTDEKLNYKFNLVFKLKAAYERLIDKKIKQSEQYKAFYDKKHKNVEFKIDDLVSVYWPTPVKGMSKKFLSSWRGPYKIKQRLGQVTYRVEKGTVSLPVHVQRLRLYVPFELTDLELRR
jgi:transposase InsO family protein